MARTHATTRRFSAIDLGNDKVITPIRNEDGELEYEMVLDGQVIGFERSAERAEAALDAVAAAQAQQLAADLADEAAERHNTCDVCGDAPASVTITEGPSAPVRLCRPCYLNGWEHNEANTTAWAAIFDSEHHAWLRTDPEEQDGPQEEGGEGGPNPEAATIHRDTPQQRTDAAWLCQTLHMPRDEARRRVRDFYAATEPDDEPPPAAPVALPLPTFDIDEAGARADHLLPLLARGFRAAPETADMLRVDLHALSAVVDTWSVVRRMVGTVACPDMAQAAYSVCEAA